MSCAVSVAEIHAGTCRGNHRTRARTDLPRRLILYGNAKAAFIGWTMGVNHSTKGAETVNAINNLALITGNIGRAGASPFSITGQCNAMGTREAGFTSSLPGYRKFEKRRIAKNWRRCGMLPWTAFPTARGLAYPDIIEAAVAKKIRALWIIATNPIVSFPNFDVLKQALETLDFLVVQDGFHPTPTTELAHLVLPAAIWGEKEGTYTNSERRVSKVNRAVATARRGACGLRHLSGRGRATWRAVTNCFPDGRAARRVSKNGGACRRAGSATTPGMTYEADREQGGVQWPLPAGVQPGKPSRLYSDGKFQTDDGRAKLIADRVGAVPRTAEPRISVYP